MGKLMTVIIRDEDPSKVWSASEQGHDRHYYHQYFPYANAETVVETNLAEKGFAVLAIHILPKGVEPDDEGAVVAIVRHAEPQLVVSGGDYDDQSEDGHRPYRILYKKTSLDETRLPHSIQQLVRACA